VTSFNVFRQGRPPEARITFRLCSTPISSEIGGGGKEAENRRAAAHKVTVDSTTLSHFGRESSSFGQDALP